MKNKFSSFKIVTIIFLIFLTIALLFLSTERDVVQQEIHKKIDLLKQHK